jgi:hypothetical protein
MEAKEQGRRGADMSRLGAEEHVETRHVASGSRGDEKVKR